MIAIADSITQQSWGPGGTGAALANLYQRKLSVWSAGEVGATCGGGADANSQLGMTKQGRSQPRTVRYIVESSARKPV